MSKVGENVSTEPELATKGALTESGVKIARGPAADRLSSSGYGTGEDKGILLTFFEALYLMDKRILEVEDGKGRKIDFRGLLRRYEDTDESAWANYLIYRDLRSRGYVVREGFGSGVDFRLYERGEYNKDTAKYLIVSVQEGKPLLLENLTNTLKQCQSLKKELVLAVMNRRGEIVHYSVSQLTLK